MLGETMVFPKLNGRDSIEADAEMSLASGAYCSGPCHSDSDCRKWVPNSYCSMRQGIEGQQFCERGCDTDAECGDSLGFKGQCIDDQRGHRACAFKEAATEPESSWAAQTVQRRPQQLPVQRQVGFGSPPCLANEVLITPSLCSSSGRGGPPAGKAEGSYCAPACNSDDDCKQAPDMHCSMNQGQTQKYCQRTCKAASGCPVGGPGYEARCDRNIVSSICTYIKTDAPAFV